MFLQFASQLYFNIVFPAQHTKIPETTKMSEDADWSRGGRMGRKTGDGCRLSSGPISAPGSVVAVKKLGYSLHATAWNVKEAEVVFPWKKHLPSPCPTAAGPGRSGW